MDEIDNEIGFVTLITGELEGKSFWADLSVFPSKYEEFIEINNSGKDYIMTDYGDVLKFALDEDHPPTEIKKEMEKIYGIDHDFEENINSAD